MNKGIKEGALDKSKQKHEDAIDILRDYFMNKRGARAFAIQQKKAMQAAVAADSTGMLKDTLPAAEPMFLTPGECDSVSYAFGNDIGNNIKSSDIPVQIVWITEAMANVRDSVAKMDEMIVQGYLQNYFMVVRPRETPRRRRSGWKASPRSRVSRRPNRACSTRSSVRATPTRSPSTTATWSW